MRRRPSDREPMQAIASRCTRSENADEPANPSQNEKPMRHLVTKPNRQVATANAPPSELGCRGHRLRLWRWYPAAVERRRWRSGRRVSEVPVALRNFLIKGVVRKMRGYTTMLVGAVFASNLLSFAADARGQVVNDGDRVGSGGGYIVAGVRGDKRGSSLQYRSRSQSGYRHDKPRCYFPQEWPKLPPLAALL